MTFAYRVGLAAIASTLGAVLACSNPGSTGSPGGTTASACGDYYDAIFASGCNGPVPPADEVARERTLFLGVCANAIALPGEGITAGELESCASAVKAAGGCRILGAAAQSCSFSSGTLAAGAACTDSGQCVSGDCSHSTAGADGGTSSASCGICTAATPVGQACPATGYCGANTTCDNGTCRAITFGDVGSSCDAIATQCKAGLYCEQTSKKCATPGGAGAACTGTEACAVPLVCVGSTCRSPGQTGATCAGDSDCASGLGCSQTTHQCAAITWVDAGQTCSPTVRCKVGGCPYANGAIGGTCPNIIPDGQPCTTTGAVSGMCDVFAQCTGGTCVALDSAVCK